ncbi:MAG: hypothetical protein E7270_00010 [Lachnospiraceae bacterium]|nr:hypothetical protein [Lachnospiraceae bacterium]
MNEVVIKIRELVLENAEIEDKNLDSLSGKKLVEDLGYDSVALIQLMCDIEDNLDITFDNLDGLIEAFGSYDTLVNFIIKTIKEGRNEKN